MKTALRRDRLTFIAWVTVCLLSLVGCSAVADAATPLRFHEIAAADGVPLNVVEGGNPKGEPLLFLHGFSQSYLSFRAQFEDPALASRFRMVAIDLRGHGGSGKPWSSDAYAGHLPWARDVRTVIETLELGKPVLVGWSFGGFVAMDYVREYGSKAVAALVLTGSHGGLIARPGGAPPAYSGDLDAAIGNARAFMKLMAVQPMAADDVDRGTFAHVMMPAYVRNAMAAKRLDNTDLRAILDARTLIILGDRDGSLPVERIRESLAVNRHIEISVFEGVGHSAFLEDSARFNRELAAFATAIPSAVTAYLDAVNRGDVDGAVNVFAADGEMRLLQNRVARGERGLREIELFHSIAAPTLAPEGLRARAEGSKTIVSFVRNVERSRVFEAMGLIRVTTAALDDAFVIEDGLIRVARQPEFAAACSALMGAALTGASDWLRQTKDPRLAKALPRGVPRMDSTTVATWIELLKDWRAATGWKPEPGLAASCAG